jgi:hypothetical protein
MESQDIYNNPWTPKKSMEIHGNPRNYTIILGIQGNPWKSMESKEI